MKTASFSTYLNDPNLLGQHFKGDSFFAAHVMAKVFDISRGHPYKLNKREQEKYEEIAGRVTIPKSLREWWKQVGRGGGKSIFDSALGLYLATHKDWSKDFSAGETAIGMHICPDRKQARITRNYIVGFIESSPQLQSVVRQITKEQIQLKTGVNLEIHTASFKSTRGYPLIYVLLDEVAFFASDEWAVHQDLEIAAAVQPGLARVKGSLLMGSSTPYAKRGLLYEKNLKFYGTENDAVLFIQGPTRTFNPTIPQQVVDDALKADEQRARAEWLGEFRDDVSSIFSTEALEAVVNYDRPIELPRSQYRYVGFLDASGGSGQDSMTAAVAHKENERLILDCVVEVRPPFSPASVSGQFAGMFKRYGVRTVRADKYAGSWPSETFQKHGVRVKPVRMSKSEIYLEFLPLLNSQQIELPNHKRLLSQLQGLERRVRSGGKDTIDHSPNSHAHDDVANAVCGAIVLAAQYRSRSVTWGRTESSQSSFLRNVVPGSLQVHQHKIISD